MKTYIVKAYRWGQMDTHSYVVGVYSDPDVAIKVAESEEEYRGGKYDCEVTEWLMDKGIEGGVNILRMITYQKIHKADILFKSIRSDS